MKTFVKVAPVPKKFIEVSSGITSKNIVFLSYIFPWNFEENS